MKKVLWFTPIFFGVLWKLAALGWLWRQHKVLAIVSGLWLLGALLILAFFMGRKRWQQRSDQRDEGSLG